MSYWLKIVEGEEDIELILVNVTSIVLNRPYIRVFSEKPASFIKLSTVDKHRVLRPDRLVVTRSALQRL